MATTNETLNIQIQNRLVEQLTLRNRELKFVNSFAENILNHIDTTDVIDMLVKNFKAYYTHEYCEVYLIDKERELLVRVKQDGEENKSYIEKKLNKSIRLGETLIGKVAVNGIAKIETVNAQKKSADKSLSSYSEIALPLIHDKKDVVGVIYSNHKEVDFFNQAQLASIMTMASIAATKILQTENLSKIKKYQTQLEEYVHIVSHDLKSPLRSINALVTWVKEDNLGKLNEPSLNHIKLIDSTLTKMDNLITNTLNYSKIDYEDFEEEDVNLNLLIEGIKSTLNLNNNNITLHVPSELPTLRGDKTKYMQIFQNLIGNAVKYMDKPQGIISIDFSLDGDVYKFSVEDNGIGIDEAYYDKIFQVFQKLSNDSNSSGVGLSIVKKLVNYYGGRLWLDSKLGEGTTFYFTLKK